jgi:hypothetical protein
MDSVVRDLNRSPHYWLISAPQSGLSWEDSKAGVADGWDHQKADLWLSGRDPHMSTPFVWAPHSMVASSSQISYTTAQGSEFQVHVYQGTKWNLKDLFHLALEVMERHFCHIHLITSKSEVGSHSRQKGDGPSPEDSCQSICEQVSFLYYF